MVSIPQPVDIGSAVRIYYAHLHLGNTEIKELFGKISSGRIVQLKNLAREVMAEENIMARDSYSVNTQAAYRAWGLDIKDLENRYSKLQALKEKESKS